MSPLAPGSCSTQLVLKPLQRRRLLPSLSFRRAHPCPQHLKLLLCQLRPSFLPAIKGSSIPTVVQYIATPPGLLPPLLLPPLLCSHTPSCTSLTAALPLAIPLLLRGSRYSALPTSLTAHNRPSERPSTQLGRPPTPSAAEALVSHITLPPNPVGRCSGTCRRVVAAR